MQRREFLGAAAGAAAAPAVYSQGKAMVKFGIDLFSIRSQGWSPFEYMDYCARLKAAVVFFSEVRFLGGLDEAHLKRVRAHADKLGLSLEVGMRSICPTSKAFDPKEGPAEEQLGRLITAARILGSPIARCFLGTSADRAAPGGIEAHFESTVRVLRAARARAMDAGVKIAIENHAGDMQARELKMLIEEAGKDFAGACLDAGNPVWAVEDPHLTLETLAPYAVTSGVRDSALWRVPEGVAVRWTRMGEGNVDIAGWVKKFAQLCPGLTLALEIIVTGPRVFRCMEPQFWEPYRKTPAWEFSRFLALAERGKPQEFAPAPKEQAAGREREDLEASAQYTRQLLGL